MIEGNKSGTTELTGLSHDHSSATINAPIIYKKNPRLKGVLSSSVAQKGKARPSCRQLTQVCNICGKLAHETKSKRLVRDHNHFTGYIRGILCDPCNGRIGTYESKKHLSKFIVKARKRSPYKLWLKIYGERIIYHLSCNTGILYRSRYGR